jgi:hypothetical protein
VRKNFTNYNIISIFFQAFRSTAPWNTAAA